MIRSLFILLGLSVMGWAWDLAIPGYRYEFPKDHFSHPAFKTEWWYYTGNLKTREGRRFGFELTFFRQAVSRDLPGEFSWQLDDLYLAHLTLSDLDGRQFFKEDRLNRAGPGLAGVDAGQGRIWNGNWDVRWLEIDIPGGPQRLRAVADDFALDLDLTSTKPPVVHGRDGVSQKAAGVGKASHYISFTRLAADGIVTLREERYQVTGTAWMDHEFSTDSLGEGQVGWDWMSIQLEDETELMLYRMRRSDGSSDPHSSGTYVDAAGLSRHIEWKDIRMTPGRTWTSPTTGGRYPLTWRVEMLPIALNLECRTLLEDQEVVAERGGPSYWEGAVQYSGRKGDRSITGVGYLEMTGYAQPLTIGFAEESAR